MVRSVNSRSRMCMRGGTHTCLVGEQTTSNTVTDRFFYRDTRCTAEYGRRIKRTTDDLHEGFRDLRDVEQNDCETSDDIDKCHERYKFFYDSGETLRSSDENEECHDSKKHSDRDRWDRELTARKDLTECCADRVCLDHVTHESERKDDQNCKNSAKDSA